MRASPCGHPNTPPAAGIAAPRSGLTWTDTDSSPSLASQRHMAAFQALHTRRIAERWPASCTYRLTPCGRTLSGFSWRVELKTSFWKQHRLVASGKEAAHRDSPAEQVVHTPTASCACPAATVRAVGAAPEACRPQHGRMWEPASRGAEGLPRPSEAAQAWSAPARDRTARTSSGRSRQPLGASMQVSASSAVKGGWHRGDRLRYQDHGVWGEKVAASDGGDAGVRCLGLGIRSAVVWAECPVASYVSRISCYTQVSMFRVVPLKLTSAGFKRCGFHVPSLATGAGKGNRLRYITSPSPSPSAPEPTSRKSGNAIASAPVCLLYRRSKQLQR